MKKDWTTIIPLTLLSVGVLLDVSTTLIALSMGMEEINPTPVMGMVMWFTIVGLLYFCRNEHWFLKGGFILVCIGWGIIAFLSGIRNYGLITFHQKLTEPLIP